MENITNWISENGIDWAVQIGIAIAIFIVGKIIARMLANLVRKAMSKSGTEPAEDMSAKVVRVKFLSKLLFNSCFDGLQDIRMHHWSTCRASIPDALEERQVLLLVELAPMSVSCEAHKVTIMQAKGHDINGVISTLVTCSGAPVTSVLALAASKRISLAVLKSPPYAV